MQFRLKQSEIETALKNYIAQQGINLTGKQVSIAFTAGRKESGISAELNIDDIDIPGIDTAEVSPNAPQAVIVPMVQKETAKVPAFLEKEPAPAIPETPDEPDAPEEVVPVKVTNSLFG